MENGIGRSECTSNSGSEFIQELPRGLLYGKGCRRLSENITRAILENYGEGDGYRFIHDILPFTTLGDAYSIKNRIIEKNQRNGIFSIVYHPEKENQGHIHLFHRCLYYASFCRCTFNRGYKIKRRRSRFTPKLSTTTDVLFWNNWINYFFQEPRKIIHLEVAGMDYSNEVCRLKNLQQSQHLTGEETNGPVEGSFFSCQSFDRDSSLELGENSENSSHIGDLENIVDRRGKHRSELRSSGKGIKYKQNCEFLLKNMEKLLCIPVESSCDTMEWLTHPELIFFNRSDPDYKKACSAYIRKTQYLTFEQISSLHTQEDVKGLYYQRTDTQFYYSISESLQYIEQLLLHQYKSIEGVKDFLKRLFEVTEKLSPKKNTMSISGPPNSGKSWFFEMVAAFYLNVGHVKNFNKYTSFPLNDCINRRILLWNEPSISPSNYETVKMLLGGDPCAAAVKYESDGKILRTPVLITTNQHPFPNADVWNCRLYHEKWQRADFLKNIHFYPHPASFCILIKKFLFE